METNITTSKLIVGGIDGRDLMSEVEPLLSQAESKAIGIASAFISVRGVNLVLSMLKRCGSPTCRLVVGVDNAITHPKALYYAREAGWKVRLSQGSPGIFHPKLIVAGSRFNRNGVLTKPSFFYVGSSNITAAGLTRNVECAYVSLDRRGAIDAARAFAVFWRQGAPATKESLANYSARFAGCSRSRPPVTLEDLGVSDTQAVNVEFDDLLGDQTPPETPAVGKEFAEVAWTGLKSFTGEFMFQVEFPRASGEVVRRMIGQDISPDSRVNIACTDGEIRSMKFDFYEHNGMFRLNIPNRLPGVDWARENREGAAVLRRNPEPGVPLRLELLRPGNELDEIIGRSSALGTWGKTSTRPYGWF